MFGQSFGGKNLPFVGTGGFLPIFGGSTTHDMMHNVSSVI
jgi:hypothetical protein